jgi:hypothetical protein
MYVRKGNGDAAKKMMGRRWRALATPNRADELPEPLKRFHARERSTMHIRLPAAARRRLRSLSEAKGVPAEELARKWVEEGLEREAG